MKYLEFYKKVLKNGLTVLFEKRDLPIISTSATVKFGSQYESEKEKGIAHLIEHLMFKGTKKRTAKQISREVEKKGGVLNGYTDEAVTSYWNKIPSKHIQSSLNIVSDLILNPRFDAEEFEKEKHVVMEEIKMYDDNLQIYSTEKIKELLYKKPFGMASMGNIKLIKSISREQAIKSFKTHYSSNKMILCIVGDTNFEDICKHAEKVFPRTKKQYVCPKIKKINRSLIEKRKGIDQTHFIFGFHAPTLRDKKRYAFEIFDVIMGEGMSSRLFQEIREKRGLAYTARSIPNIQPGFGYELFYAGTVAEKIEKIKEIILREMKKINELNKKDFEQAKEQLIGLNKLRNEDSINTMNGLMMAEVTGNAGEYYKYDERISAVKLSDVRQFSRLKNYSTMSLVPER